MEKKYVVKDFVSQRYFSGYNGRYPLWEEEPNWVEYFDTIEDAENFIKREDGAFQIETVYIV